MKKRFSMSVVCAAAISLCSVTVMRAQEGGGGPALPQLPFHLVEGFFHYPAHSVIGRLSGVAVTAGAIVALNRGYHPVLEFKADGTFVRSWGEGSRMFEGAHSVRFDPQGHPIHQLACPDENTLYLANLYASRLDKWVAQ